MKILRIIPSMDPSAGGPPQGIRNLTPALAQLGFDTTVVCMDANTFQEGDTGGYKIISLGKSKSPWKFHSKLSRWLDDEIGNYDVVIVHGLWLYHGYCVFKKISKIRQAGLSCPLFYIYPHGMLDPWFQSAKSRRFKAWRNYLYWLGIENRIIKSADAILFTSEEEKRLAEITFPFYRGRGVVVGYGVGVPALKEKSYSPDLDKPYFLFLSRIDSKKGLDILLESYARLKKLKSNIPDLFIAGKDDGRYADLMKDLAVSLEIDKNLKWLGLVLGDEKWELIRRAKAFVLPSHQENFGIAVVEALANKVPVLTTNRVNIWREIENSGGGIISDDNVDSFFPLMEKCVEWSSSEEDERRIAAYSCYEMNFSVYKAAEVLSNFLSEEYAHGKALIYGK